MPQETERANSFTIATHCTGYHERLVAETRIDAPGQAVTSVSARRTVLGQDAWL